MKKYDYVEWNKRQHFNLINTVKSSSALSLDTSANIISVSGCWDTQVSYDLGYNGALTSAFMKIINLYNPKETNFFHLIQNLRGMLLQMRISQTPQLMYGKEMNLKINLSEFLNI
jgi:hypothetical protein